MAGSISVPAVNRPILAVRELLRGASRNSKALCSAINDCVTSQSRRYVLSAVDSVFEEVPPDSLKHMQSYRNRKKLLGTLFKLPRALYVPRFQDVTAPGPDFGAILDEQVQKLAQRKTNLHDLSLLIKELGTTVEFMAEHSLNELHGPLRESAICLLSLYKRALLEDQSLGDLKKLILATQLFNVLKLHSIDSEDLDTMIQDIIAKTPSIVRQCSVGTLDTLTKMKLSKQHSNVLDEHLSMISAKGNDLENWSELFWMVARNSENRKTIDCYLHGHKIVMRNYQLDEKGKPYPNRALMNMVYGIITLQKRLKQTDPVFRNALRVMESIWPALEAQIASFEPTELVAIAECYFEIHRLVNPLMKNGSRNCLDFLVGEVSRRSAEFLLRDWVAIIEALDRVANCMVVNVLLEKPGNYYLRAEEIQKAWMAQLVDTLKSYSMEEMADSIYSLSFPQCSNLCKHLISSGLYEEPLSSVLERRCLSLITDVRYQANRHLLDFYFVQLQMVLPLQSNLRIALEGNKPLRDILSLMSGRNLMKLLDLSKYCRQADARILLQKLSQKIESNVLALDEQEYLEVLRHATHFKYSDLINAVVAAVTPGLIYAAEPHKGFAKMLEFSKFAMLVPLHEGRDLTASTLLNEQIVQHALGHVQHLSLLHLEMLLQNIRHSGTFPKKLLGDIMLHAMDVDLSGMSPSQITNFLVALLDLGVRHEVLIDRLENSLLIGLIDLDNEAAAGVLSSLANMMARIGKKSHHLAELFERIVKSESVPLSKWDYDNLKLRTKVNLLHAISSFSGVNKDFEKKYLRLLKDCEHTVQHMENSVDFTQLDDAAYRNLYDMYISLLINGIETEAAKSEFLHEHLPCYHWFTHQEQLCSEFKDSPLYVQLKNALHRIGIEGAESKVTEAYFAHMVLDDQECAKLLGSSNTLLYVVPPADELRWWTSKSEVNSDVASNEIESYKFAIGQSARVIDHLKRSGWNVITLFLPEWDAMNNAQREQYLKRALKINTN